MSVIFTLNPRCLKVIYFFRLLAFGGGGGVVLVDSVLFISGATCPKMSPLLRVSMIGERDSRHALFLRISQAYKAID